MYKLNYFVPVEDKEKTKQALFELGVGKIGDYECCCWESLGVGQFKPIGSANPHVGKLYTVERVQEYKVEIICSATLIDKAVHTLKEVHPYEEVAYEVFKIEDF